MEKPTRDELEKTYAEHKSIYKFGELSEKSYIPEWIIVGAETGSRKDKVIPRREWIENIVEQCRKYNIPVFMKPSLTDIWGEELIQEFPKALIHA